MMQDIVHFTITTERRDGKFWVIARQGGQEIQSMGPFRKQKDADSIGVELAKRVRAQDKKEIIL